MNNSKDAKRQYERPVVKRFPLRPEEAVLGFCKSTATPGSSGGTCTVVPICKMPGS